MADTLATIRDYILEEMVPDGDVELDETTNLLDEEIVDSLGLFTLVAFINRNFDVTIEPEEINLDNFETLTTIVSLVESKQG